MIKESDRFAFGDVLKNPDMAERYEAMISMGEAGSLPTEELGRLCLRDDEPFIRKRALAMLATRREKGYLDILCEALRDRDPMVRIIAAEHLHACALEGEKVRLVEVLKPLLRDSDPGVRTRVVSLLINSREKGITELVLEVFFEVLDRGRNQEEIDRHAVLVALLRDRKVPKHLSKKLDSLAEEKKLRGLLALRRAGIEVASS
ncbi:MAG: hypothetical protein A2Z06_02415 [Candidatus Glassbacteria bacterium RBG_16_58_8]|uniref:HEAT repeat domain-containing protein n=1 Tax=Candidatus Glassbacteria bacterium RBG_16_58_8 TaxID=1817866 RepID=A0A1F5YB27_9BACT|nr:MAG: hypothetical protein A2Z06_02415 [Candidatus Glassbacteria bacterium RBG_16_58_8]